MTNKPKITVTPDDGGHDNTISVAGVKQTAYEPNDKYEYYDDSDFLYHAIERIAELEAERDQLRQQVKQREGLVNRAIEKEVQYDALVAHVERLRYTLDKIFYQPVPGEISEELQEIYDMAGLALALTDEQCPSRIRAEAKAEALEDFRSEFELHCEVPDFILGCLEEYADQYRQQAEEGE